MSDQYTIAHLFSCVIGDLGVQRGLLIWLLSLHSPSHSFSISPKKVGGSKEHGADDVGNDKLQNEENSTTTVEPSVPAGRALEMEDLLEFRPTSTTLERALVDPGQRPTPLPPGLDVAALKSRLDGKKIK